MGQQQILFLILAVCIIGIAVSAGVIVMQSDANLEHRQEMYNGLKKLAGEAQAYRRLPFDQGGGEGTFLGLTATPAGIRKIAANPSTPYAEFSIARNGSSRCVQILALGTSPGNNPHMPMKMVVTVFPDSTAVTVLN